MLFITPAKSARHAKDYYTEHLSRSDYYMKDAQEMPGQWHGLGAELLGLSGTVDKERYFDLCDNINPATGERLTPHTKTQRRVAYDFTFDAPKSVSLAYELGGNERIMDAFRNAVQDTMSEMEAAVMTRVRSNKRWENRASANMVWAEFIHRTTRPVEDENGMLIPSRSCTVTRLHSTPVMTPMRTSGRRLNSPTWCATRAIIRRRSIAVLRRICERSAMASSATATASGLPELTRKSPKDSRTGRR